MSEKKPDQGKRNFIVATSVVGGVASVAAAVPFVASMLPSERAKALGAPVEVDVSKLSAGEMMRVEWRGKPVWIVRRTKDMLDSIKKSDEKVTDPQLRVNHQPEYAKNEAARSNRRFWCSKASALTLLLSSVQTKEISADRADWVGGFYCPCHGSKFDFAGRVYKERRRRPI
jgi:ubiquinol-cytochrome c reductase iron-sulfur subunit